MMLMWLLPSAALVFSGQSTKTQDNIFFFQSDVFQPLQQKGALCGSRLLIRGSVWLLFPSSTTFLYFPVLILENVVVSSLVHPMLLSSAVSLPRSRRSKLPQHLSHAVSKSLNTCHFCVIYLLGIRCVKLLIHTPGCEHFNEGTIFYLVPFYWRKDTQCSLWHVSSRASHRKTAWMGRQHHSGERHWTKAHG